MLNVPLGLKVFIAPGATDMRKSVRGLSLTVNQILKRDPRCGHVFAFCNRRRKLAKVLIYDGLGFWLLLRTLDQRKFQWPEPKPGASAVELDAEQLSWLLSGIDWQRLSAQTTERSKLSYDEARPSLPEPRFLDLL